MHFTLEEDYSQTSAGRYPTGYPKYSPHPILYSLKPNIYKTDLGVSQINSHPGRSHNTSG